MTFIGKSSLVQCSYGLVFSSKTVVPAVVDYENCVFSIWE